MNEDGTYNVQVLDDKDIPGDTLAARRLVLLKQGIKLKKLGNAIFFIGDLIKLAHHGVWFIDSLGNLFTHIKMERASLVFRKIVKKIPINTGGYIIEVEGLPTRFKCLHGPKATEPYAGILKHGNNHILYGFYEKEYDKTWRKI